MAVAVASYKRRNPFGETTSSSQMVQRSRTDVDLEAVYAHTRRLMQLGQRDASVAQSRVATGAMDVTSNGRVAACWCCAQTCQPIECNSCARPICGLCTRQCEGCCEVFCNYCSMTNYDMCHERTFCLACTAIEQQRAATAAALAMAARSSSPKNGSPSAARSAPRVGVTMS